MRVIVNGAERALDEGATVSELLEQLGMNRDGVAVAVDRSVVPRSQHDQRVLVDGAKIEVIRAVGGG